MNYRLLFLVALVTFCGGCVAYSPYPYSYGYDPYGAGSYSYSYPYSSPSGPYSYGYGVYTSPPYRPPVYYAPAWPVIYPNISLSFGSSHYRHRGGPSWHRHRHRR
ncbi:hypothetical protein [Desulfobulbus oligotrophicus]|uniref:Lipoprotein n=1 Tax=Desulfobulbus oligotrophicus TaxID=1909699 RepID=A0A7T6AQX0_9BACT|nr:hypothetical protein [Desulfobulbus oligotrophicus]MDY0389412.1 hypothetical protein [Desulfobulbus oligotrophicus]QQG65945.1 hypothetical protein HP555_08730 [Desulfobulbus oligotrophicus]